MLTRSSIYQWYNEVHPCQLGDQEQKADQLNIPLLQKGKHLKSVARKILPIESKLPIVFARQAHT